MVGDTYTILLSGKDTAGRFALIDMLIPGGSGPPPHRHDFEETSCGVAWGHSGSFPGYWTYAFTSANGKRQAVLMANADPSAVPKPGRVLFYKLLDNAYCSTA